MQDKNIDMVFRKEITDTIYDNNKIIYRYILKGESKAVTKNTNQYEIMIGTKLPSFSLKSIDGNVVTSDELLGKPLVINMWFTTCAPCIAEMPELNKIKADALNKEVQFFAVTYENNEKVTQFLEKKTFDFTHLVDAKDYCETFTNQFPINIFVNRNGIITDIKGGMPLIYDSKLKKITDKVNPKNFIKALEEIK
ncbi:TlpA family protein disulfide reductase [Winogradskyella litorisediminis]|uniref:TlpA family protein disulfide reductase n=1 Tax=Winogradskyella litorisediminis TaxID=1156618 RepID=A0ABW3N5Z5_9FLAO